MEIVITSDSKDVLLREDFETLVDRISSPEFLEDMQRKESTHWDVEMKELCFDGIHMTYATAQVYDNIHIETVDNNATVGSFFLQRGNMSTTAHSVARNMHFTTREHNLMFNPSAVESTYVQKQNDIELFALSFSRERFLQVAENNGSMLDRMASDIAVNRPAILNLKNNLVLTPRIQQVINEIKTCCFQGGIKKLFLQSKALELLALQCQQFESTQQGKGATTWKPTPADVQKIYLARDILLHDLGNVPSLSGLSRLTGLNEFKLKSGFKKIFGNTVFGYLSDHRLELARQWLQGRQKTLTEIAADAGYSSLSHFSHAFRKKFGISPGKMKGIC